MSARAKPSTYQPKPPRLRSACNQCNTAKVKCSGERDGCARCRALRVECVFQESRVGKVQGRRGPRASKEQPAVPGHDANEQDHEQDHEQDQDDEEQEQEQDQQEQDQQEQDQQEQQEPNDAFDSWIADWERDMQILDAPLPPPAGTGILEGQQQATPISSSAMSTLGFTLEGAGSTGVGAQETASTKAAAPACQPAAPSAEAASKLDSKCILACSRIMATLENYILSGLKALDLILGSVQRVVQDLRLLIQLQQQSRCERCILLFVAIMHQITELLEVGLSPTIADEESGMDSMFLSGTPYGFGSLSASLEEQRRWRSQMVRRELQHVKEILSGVIVVTRMGPRGSSYSPQISEQRVQCLAGLEKRLDDLSNRECGPSGAGP